MLDTCNITDRQKERLHLVVGAKSLGAKANSKRCFLGEGGLQPCYKTCVPQVKKNNFLTFWGSKHSGGKYFHLISSSVVVVVVVKAQLKKHGKASTHP